MYQLMNYQMVHNMKYLEPHFVEAAMHPKAGFDGLQDTGVSTGYPAPSRSCRLSNFWEE
jgi:hypothetical protein